MPAVSDIDEFLEWATESHTSQRQAAIIALAAAAQNAALVAEYVARIDIPREDIEDYDAFLA